MQSLLYMSFFDSEEALFLQSSRARQAHCLLSHKVKRVKSHVNINPKTQDHGHASNRQVCFIK